MAVAEQIALTEQPGEELEEFAPIVFGNYSEDISITIGQQCGINLGQTRIEDCSHGTREEMD